MNATINGLDLYYEIHGDGPTVLCVHGFPLSGALWTPVAERLADRCRLVVPDLRGHGRSAVAPTATMGDFADDVAGLLDTLDTQRTVVVGLSMGGYVAMEFYRRYGDRVEALVLADTRAEADTPEVAADRIKLADRVMTEGSSIIADGMLDILFAPNAPSDLKKAWHDIMAATPPAGVAAALRGMAERPDSFGTLRTIHQPVLVVVGELDVITPPTGARAMHAALPNGRLHIISDAGHMTPVENPDRFAFVLNQFLDSLS